MTAIIELEISLAERKSERQRFYQKWLSRILAAKSDRELAYSLNSFDHMVLTDTQWTSLVKTAEMVREVVR